MNFPLSIPTCLIIIFLLNFASFLVYYKWTEGKCPSFKFIGEIFYNAWVYFIFIGICFLIVTFIPLAIFNFILIFLKIKFPNIPTFIQFWEANIIEWLIAGFIAAIVISGIYTHFELEDYKTLREKHDKLIKSHTNEKKD